MNAEDYIKEKAKSEWGLRLILEGISDSQKPVLYRLLENYAQEQVKNCSIPDVVLSEERTELPEVGCMNSLGCACKEANGYPLTDCGYWEGN